MRYNGVYEAPHPDRACHNIYCIRIGRKRERADAHHAARGNVNPALLGSPLSIRLDISANDSPRSTHFDNVRLVRRDIPTGIKTLRVGSIASIDVFPNPFNPNTTISFTLQSAGPVTLGVYNARGQLVDRLIDQRFYGAGEHRIQYNAKATSGVYFLRLDNGIQPTVRKLLLLK